jgi:hypothetical protein
MSKKPKYRIVKTTGRDFDYYHIEIANEGEWLKSSILYHSLNSARANLLKLKIKEETDIVVTYDADLNEL